MLNSGLKFFILFTMHYYSAALASDIGLNDVLYQKIINEFQNQYTSIGQNEAQKILSSKGVEVHGGLNSVGFSYKKPFVDFTIELERHLAPDLFSETRWIVTDSLLIEIEATKLLNRLKNDGQIDYSEKNLALYAGLVFKRKFTWVHFADSYKDGLTKNLTKLFFPFLSYNSDALSKMSINELLTKEDHIGFRSGGVATVPIYHGISASAGFLTSFKKLSKTEMYISQSFEDGTLSAHVSNESASMASGEFNFSVVANFLKIIKLNLLSYDFSYEKIQSRSVYLLLPQSFFKESISNGTQNELRLVLNNKDYKLFYLKPFLISEEEKLSLALTHKYNFLLFGGMKSANTEQITISDGNKNITYFRHIFEKIKYIEDPWAKLLGSLLYSLTNTRSRISEITHESRKMSIEYASFKNLIDKKEELKLLNDKAISINFNIEFNSNYKKNYLSKKIKKNNLYFIDHLSELSSEVSSWIEEDELTTPSHFRAQFMVQQLGLEYFNKLKVSAVFDEFNFMCTNYPKTTFFNFRNFFDHCNHVLQNDFVNYFKNLRHEKVTASVIDLCEKKSMKYLFNSSKRRNFIKSCIDSGTEKTDVKNDSIPLWDLKNLLSSIVASVNDKVSFYNLFGARNVFHFGSLSAKTASLDDFVVNYHAGLFQNLGVIDDYMRSNNLRSPSSIYLGY